MKKFYYLLITLAISSLSFGQVEVFDLAGGGVFPSGWTATNNVTTNDIDRGSYFLLDSGDPSDIIETAVYDLSGYSSAEFTFDVATFGGGGNNSATIEISYDGGITYTQSETSAVATSSSYIAGGAFAVTPSAQVMIKLTNSGISGKGNRLKNLVLTAQEPIQSDCDYEVTHCYTSGSYLIFDSVVDNIGDYITVTINAGDTESGYDDLVVYDSTDSSGNILYSDDGNHAGQVIESTTGEISVWIDGDGSYNCTDGNGGPYSPLDMVVSCSAPPACIQPSALTVADITNNSVNLSWTAGGTETDYEYVVQDAGTGEPTGAGIAVTGATTVTVNTLTAATDYEIYVRSNCDANGFSAWTGPLTFTTEPAPIVPDYTNNFSTYPGENWSEGTGETSPSGTSSGWFSDGFGNVGSTGSAGVNIYSTGGDEWLITPTFDLSSGGYEINLDVALTTFSGTSSAVIGDDDAVYLMQSTDNGVNWTTLLTWDADNSPSNTGDNVTVDISALTSATTKFALFMLEGTSSGGDVNFYVDNFSVRTPPSCFSPQSNSLSVANVTSSSVDISWAQGGTETDYQYVIQDAGTGEPTGVGIAVTGATTVTDTTLTAATDYEIYVRSNCDANGFSAWVGPETFTTEPDPIVPDYTNNFSTYPGENWSEGTGETSPSGTSSGWFSDGFGNVGSTGSAGVNIYSTGGDEWLITPTFDLSSGGYEINLDVALTTFSGTSSAVIGDDDAVYLMQSTDNGVNWTTLLTWDADNSPSNTGDNVTVDISALTSATTKFALFMLEGSSSGGDVNFYVDNFSVRTPPSCLPPQSNSLSVANVTSSSVDISWAQGGTETDYEYVVQEAGTGEPTGAGMTVTGATTVTVNTLISATDYEIYVRSNCDANGFSAWVGPQTFTTAYTCGDTLYDSGGATGNYANNELTTVTVYPDTAGDLVTFTFLSFETEANYDEIWVYDGPDTNATVILDEYSGSTIPDPITSSHPTGALTFVFDSDVSTTRSGYEILTSCSTPLGMDTVSKSNFTYFPNPVNNVLSIKAQASIDSITVYNMLGQTVVKSTPNTTTTAVDMSGLQTGAYFVQVAINNSIETVRVLKN